MERRIKGKVKGKAIIGIAVAAIMLASVMAVLPGMSMVEVIKIPVPPDGKIQISPDEYIGKEVVLVVEQLALAGTPVLIEGKSGWMVKAVLLKALAGDKMMEIEKEHIYQLGEHEIKVVFNQGDMIKERLMKVRVVDRVKPIISVKEGIISKNEGMFSIRVSDNCDAAPTVDAVMMLPSLKCLDIEQKEAKEVMLEIDLNEMKAELKGPEKIREKMMKAMMNDGVMPVMMQKQQIDIQVEKGKDVLKYEYKYDETGMLKIEGSGMEVLTVKATDKSGNIATKDVMLALLGME
jgi:hypothetical protein